MIHLAKSFSRLIKHLNDDEPFSVVSAHRDEYSDKDNAKRHQELKKKIRSLGYRFIEFKAIWKEDGMTTSEKYFFIPNCSKKDAIRMGMDYDQHSILWGNGEGYIYQVCTSDSCGGIASVIEVFKHNDISESNFEKIFSTLKKGGQSDGDKKLQLSNIIVVDGPSNSPIKDLRR